MPSQTSLYFKAHGQVQGIGYRWFVCETANSLKLTGWVRNLPNGDVEGEATGDPTTLQSFLSTLRTGHPHARVDSLDTGPLTNPTPATAFRIVH